MNVSVRLRKLKKNVKGLGGKGRLTDAKINTLQNYFGIALRQNVEKLNDVHVLHQCAMLPDTMILALVPKIHGVSIAWTN